jgi:hypothetical protein
VKKPKHAKGHQPIHNLGAWAHPAKPNKVTRVGAADHQVGNISPKMAGPKVKPGAVSKPRMRKVRTHAS